MQRRDAGAALLAAMLTVTLVATFAAAALWQQWRAVEIESADRHRVQSAWILTGALDWARLILREDLRSSRGIDHLAEPWAVPLQEARLTTFLAADQNNNASDGSDPDNVFLSGDITDLQGRLNLTSLLGAGVLQDKPLESFRRLFELLGLPPQQLTTLAENLRFANDIHIDNRNGAQAALQPQRTEQLVWLGLPPESAAALAPYVTILPKATPVNLNTAAAEVIYAVGRNISLADAERIVAHREGQHLRGKQDLTALLPAGGEMDDTQTAYGSEFFEVRGRLRIDNVVIEERSLVQREGLNVRALQRERGAFERFGGTRAAPPGAPPTMPAIR